MSLMQYISITKRQAENALRGPVDPPQVSLHGADKYHGAISAGYDAKRQGDPKWLLEQYWIEDMLDDLPQGSVILDIPCGTGRFFPFYGEKGFIVKALDKSQDQLNIAVQRPSIDPAKFRLAQGDVRKLGAPDKCVDAAVLCRLSRWLSPADLVTALKELQRVTRQRIILTARIANHPHARSIELIESALEGWHIARNEVGSDMDYRILMAVPA